MLHFYKSFSFMLGFMILVLIFNMLFGSKFVEWFLLLVLLSMAVVNANKFGAIFSGISKEV